MATEFHTQKFKLQIPSELSQHRKEHLEKLLEKCNVVDDILREYINLLYTEKTLLDHFKEEFQKENKFDQPIKGNLNFKDPVYVKYSSNYKAISSVLEGKSDQENTSKALSELISLMKNAHLYTELKKNSTMTEESNATKVSPAVNVSLRETVKQSSDPQSLQQTSGVGGNAQQRGKLLIDSVKQEMILVPRIEMEQMTRRLQSQHREIEELSSRLSRFASDKLTDGNPHIADLSDKNRPIKVGEMFGELYDSEWSEAFEDFRDICHSNEEQIIYELLKIVRHAYKFCGDIEQKQQEKLVHQMKDGILKIDVTMQDKKEFRRVSQEHSSLQGISERFAKNYRKECALNSVEAVVSLFIKTVIEDHFSWGKNPYSDNINRYIRKCVELVWLMSVQDPQMILKWPREGEKMNTSIYSYYGNKGKKVKLAVWPAVILYEGGPLVSKGYAQPS